MKRWLAIALLALVASACTNEDGAVHALQAEGFTHIRTTGYSWFGCGKGDDTCTGFEADRPGIAPLSGFHVVGVVGCGWGPFAKGCTVRISQ